MSFPNYKRRWIYKVPDGWEDLGKVEDDSSYFTHVFCKSTVRIGKEDGQLFRYCPRCMVKTSSYTQSSPRPRYAPGP